MYLKNAIAEIRYTFFISYCVVLYFWYNAIKIVSGLLNKKFLILFWFLKILAGGERGVLYYKILIFFGCSINRDMCADRLVLFLKKGKIYACLRD